ncbi:MAG: GntR family transcriptional regulator [Clostridiaceae bacterium]|nr:GntR family transcriptional regulator [Clostridiaceae bacterium]
MIQKTSTYNVYKVIKEKILNCQYEPGQYMSEKEIVEELRTSRTPVREALNILSGQGLIEIIPNKGIQISPLSLKRMKEIYELRRLIEPIAVREALRYINSKDLEYLSNMDENLSSCYEREDITEVFRWGKDIHLYIAKLSKNDILYRIVKLLREESFRGYIYYLKKYLDNCTGENRRAAEETLSSIHNKLVNALKEGDEEKAANAIVEDIDTMIKMVIQS